MKFSVVIPAYNEEQYLPRLLKSIEIARANYSAGSDQIEVIVADNDSTDATAEVAALHGARVVTVAKRRIAAARNGGARVARGEILCFIDADSAIHPQTFDEVDRAMKTGRYVWGAGPYGTRDQAGNVAEWTADAYIHEDAEKGYDNLSPVNPASSLGRRSR